MYREVEDVVEAVRNAKRRMRKCALLIGAGCSATAGIPLAGEFVDIIKKEHARDFARAAQKSAPKSPTYPHCMAELSDSERRDLITRYVANASINWTHLAIAQLMKEGFVDRIYTTNFDPLVLRACALVGEFPAVYDFAASQYFKPAYLPDKAVFHLHGQHTGFVLLHTDEQVKQLSQSIEPLFDDAARGRLWLVVGYSGDNDPVFKQLAKVNRFDERLYWIGYRDFEPSVDVRENLLGESRSAFFVKGHDSDEFFCLLAQKLGCFPPLFVERPFTHLANTLKTIQPYTLPGQVARIDVRETTKVLLSRAIEDLEEGSERATLLGEMYLMRGQYDAVIELVSEDMSPRLADTVAWAHVIQANEHFDQAKAKAGEAADALFDRARQKYATALKIKPGMHEALNDWGNALSWQAKTKTGAAADALFDQAGQMYAAAIAIKPDDHESLFNWGNALSEQAKTKTGGEAAALFEQAGQRYGAALRIAPDMHVALVNWAIALLDQADTKFGNTAVVLLDSAVEKLLRAEELQPGAGSYNLACIESLRNNENACRMLLASCREYGRLPPRKHLETDSDLESVRACEWFQELLRQL